MKRRFFVLLLAVICLTALLVSCGENSDCVHADADKNQVCDGCGIPVFTVTEYVPAEEEAVETVVVPMPANAKFSDYIVSGSIDVIKADKVTDISDIAANTSEKSGRIYLVSYVEADETDPDDVKYTKVVQIYDIIAGKALVEQSVAYDPTDEYASTLAIDLVDSTVISITKSVYNTETYEYDYTCTYYTLAGNQIVSTDETVSADKLITRDGVTYVAIGDTTYAVNEDGAVIHSAESSAFVMRPVFAYADDKYGIVDYNGSVYVYDLSKWLECVYSYDIPGYYVDADVFCLDGGKVLVQGIRMTASDAVNYDVLEEGAKYFIDYIMIDPAAKTATEVEFGYYIESADVLDETETASAAKNELVVSTIVSKQLMNDGVTLLVDSSLNIVVNKTASLPALVSEVEWVAPGYYVATVVYGEGSSVNAVYNANGEQVAVLPNNYTACGEQVIVDGKIYSWDMTLKLDPAKDGYELWLTLKNGVILRKDNATYYYNTSKSAPVALSEDNSVKYLNSYVSGFFVMYDSTEGAEKPYTVYNANGELLLELETNIYNIFSIEGEDGVREVVLTNGDRYIIQ